MFDQQAARTPDKVALECGSDVLSYSQLQAVSHSIAHELRITGVQPYIDSVGICCGRSTAAYVSVLGTLRAGAAYVPLDPSYPSDRLRVMMEDSSPAVILVLEAYEDKLQADGFTLLRVDGILRISTAAQPATTVADVPYNLDAPAYIIFTSGSTGRPKGVVQSLRCLYNLICWQLGNGGLGHACRTLQFAPLSFDVHFQELFSAWVNGGSLVGIDESLRRDPPRLLQFISEQRIERIFAPFVALQHVSENFFPEDKLLLHLKQVITAGEQLQLTPSLLQLLAAVPGCELHNHYGPSETHVCTWHPLLGDPEGWVQRGALPPIGKPIANTRAYVVDPTSLQLVPIGIPGELLIGGACVAIGYKGDLVRWLPDGGLEFLGRIDGQVKVRGHRIEVGEIEAALGRHPLVRRVVVIARDVSGIKELVAYVVLNRSSQLAGTTEVPPTSLLRDHLRNIFPDYMVPSSIMVLEAFPLTPSGKVDRKALPEPDRERPDELGNALAGPRNDVERRLCAVWAEVLKLPADKVGVFDSFFELGGHSIAAMRLISRVRHELGANISIGAVFASEPTIAALAKHIASNCPVELSSELEIQAQETDVAVSPRARSPAIQARAPCMRM
ncbi:hypothetical protein AB1Y20_021725 [Prymnesium parvum]|uniref:Carrier domain-containing protein n=1 Tax=Prymnesium parvum TaxID=97485 RepID=A0AB34JN05_PRYPA